MNKTIITIALAVIVFAGIAWAARPDSQNAEISSPSSELQTQGPLSAEERTFDFQSISMASGNVSHSFKIKNNGTDPLVIEKIYTSCMCTTASLIKGEEQFGPYGMAGHGFIPKINEVIGPGEEATIEVVFDPTAHGPAGIGPIERSIIIENDSGKPLELGFSAVVTP